MKLFQTLLLLMLFLIFGYTLYVGTGVGWDFATPFIDGVKSMNWFGQFNLDFLGYLILSSIWIGWRGDFKPIAVVLALLNLTFGLLFFLPYVLQLTLKYKGNVSKLLLGLRVE